MFAYKEWSNLVQKEDKNNPFSALYIYEDGSSFYVEPLYHTALNNLEIIRPGSKDKVLAEMEKIVKKNKSVVFVGDEDSIATHVEKAIYLCLTDVLDRLNIFVEDKSRGCDYGD